MDYILNDKYLLTFNSKKRAKSHSAKPSKIQNNKRNKNTNWDKFNSLLGKGPKKFRSSIKNFSVNAVPKLDSYFISNTFFQNSTMNKDKFEPFVRNKTSFYKKSDLKQENINDIQIGEIELLWEELGITYDYQDQFELYFSSINNIIYKNIFLLTEKNNLNKIKDALINFYQSKVKRKKYIEILKSLNNKIKEEALLNDNRISKEIVKEVINCIKSIRFNSINVVNNLIKVREALTCYSLQEKINIEILEKNFLFDNNYLLKMNSEISFLKNSEIEHIFEKNDDEDYLDTFLTLYTDIKNNRNEIISNPISKELMTEIDKSRYYIMQDSFLIYIRNKKILKTKNKHRDKKFNIKKKNNTMMTLSHLPNKDFIDVNNNNYNNNNYHDISLKKMKMDLGKDIIIFF